MEALAKFEAGDRWAARHNPHSPMHTAPLMQPGRDAGSIADVSPATQGLRDCVLDLVGFAKTGGPSLPDGAA